MELAEGNKELSIIVTYGGENDVKTREMSGVIAGILKGDSQDIFISEDTLRRMMGESGADVMLNNGMIQVDGLAIFSWRNINSHYGY